MATLKGTYSKGTETIEYKNRDGKVATVGFRMGPEENLTSASFTAQNGIFYLTSDTHRLYIGNSDGSISPVNQGVITVTSLPDYSNAIPGQFYYISTSNVLATYNGTDWFQINPDTQVESIEHSATAGTNSALIQTTVGQIGGSHSTQQVLSNEVTIKGANEIAVTVDSNNVITLTDASYTIEAANVKDASNNDIENKIAINLQKDPANNTDPTKIVTEGSVTLTGSNGVKISQSNNVITVDASEAMNQASQDAITGIDARNLAEGFDIVLTTGLGEEIECGTKLDPVISYGIGSNDVYASVNFKNGTALLPVYSMGEVDNLVNKAFMQANALTYKGTVGSGGKVTALPGIADNVSIGDVYMSNGSYDGYDSGTLFIAVGEEDEDTGFINKNLEWTVVDNFNTDTQTVVDLSADHAISFSNVAGDETTYLGSFKVVGSAGNPITVSNENKVSDLNADATDKTITITHNVIENKHTAAAPSTGTEYDTLFSTNEVLGVIGRDDWGHVTSSANVTLEVPTEIFTEEETEAEVEVTSVDNTDKSVTYTGVFSDEYALQNAYTNFEITKIKSNHTIVSTSLKLESHETAGMTIDLVWGQF